MDSYILIAKTFWTALVHGTWEQIGEVLVLSISLLAIGPIVKGLRYAVYIGVGINILVSLLYFYRTKKLRYMLFMLANLFILIWLMNSN